MKKKYKILIIVSSIILAAVIISIIVVSVKRSEQISFLVLEKHYSLLYEDKPTMDISIFSNKKDNYYFDQSHIDKIFLYNESDSYSVKMISFDSQEGSISYNKKDYYENKLSIKLDVDTVDSINIKHAKLKICFVNDHVLDLSIGNISFKKTMAKSYINIEKVQSIVTNVDNYTTLAAVYVKLQSDSNIVIKNITPISSSLKVNYNYYLVKDSEFEVDNNIEVKELFGSSYTINNQSSTGFKQLEINNESKVIVLPLSYIENEFVDSCGLLIDFTIDDVNYQEIVNPYVLFKTMDNERFIYEYKPIKN